jgi:hypothetical protein
MSNKKQTVMQDLREDLLASINSAKEALSEIENQVVRSACQEVARLTLKQIIKRIDDELLEKEKQQIIEAHAVGRIKECSGINTDGEQYYNETYEQ